MRSIIIATSAIGQQNVLLRITGNAGFSILLGLSAFAALLVIWVPSLADRERMRGFVLRFLLITFLLRFAVPFLVIGSSVVCFSTTPDNSARNQLASAGAN